MTTPRTNEVFLKNTLYYKLRILNYIFWAENGMVAGAINSRVFWLIFDGKTGKITYEQP
jgi:hypothetical protein